MKLGEGGPVLAMVGKVHHAMPASLAMVGRMTREEIGTVCAAGELVDKYYA